MNKISIIYANHKKSSHKRKVPANLEKDVCVYLKAKNKLGICKRKCEIKTNYVRENVSLPWDSKRKNLFFLF